MATIFRPPVFVTLYQRPKAQPEYAVNLLTLYAPNPDRPFRQSDWPLAARPKQPQDAAAPANLNPLIYPNPARPFHQDGWDSAASARPRATGEAQGTLNSLLTPPSVAAPFAQYEWQTAARVQLPLKSDSYWGAFPLYSPNPSTPFRQQLWDSAARTPPKAIGDAVAGISALLTPNPAQPFALLDWSRTPVRYKPAVDDVANLLPARTIVVTIAPFVQGDWPNPTRAVAPTVDLGTWAQGFRAQLVDAVVAPAPPNNYDWPNPTLASRSADPLSWVDQFNIQLNFPGVVVPPDVVPETPRPEVWWPVTRRKRDIEREEEAKKLAAAIDGLEDAQSFKEIEAKARAVAKAARAYNEEHGLGASYRRQLEQEIKVLTSREAERSLAARQKIALDAAYSIEQMLTEQRTRDDDAVTALLLADF